MATKPQTTEKPADEAAKKEPVTSNDEKQVEEFGKGSPEFEAALAAPVPTMTPEQEELVNAAMSEPDPSNDPLDDLFPTKPPAEMIDFMRRVVAIVEGTNENTPDSHMIGGTAHGTINLGDLRMLYATIPTEAL